MSKARPQPQPGGTHAPAAPGRAGRRLGGWLAGALLWGLGMMLAVLVALYLRNRLETGRLGGILLIYFIGGALAWLPARGMVLLLARRARAETRFAAHFFCLTVFTVGFTTLAFALDYRAFYAQWHAAAFTRIWWLQQFFTLAGAAYQFLVIGLPLFLPLGLPLLLATSIWLARATPAARLSGAKRRPGRR